MRLLKFIRTGLLCLLLSPFIVDSCPSAESIAPLCTCRSFTDSNMMFCQGILSPEELIGPIKEIAMSKANLLAIQIENSSLLYIPNGIFRDAHVEKIRFLSTELMSLSDSDVAFSGLEDLLTELRATDAHYITQWDWQQLRNLKRLQLIDINWIEMGTIDHPFPELPELTHLGIVRAEISFIVDNAFSNLNKLTILNMKENDISDLKRNMLPNPAEKLLILDFSDNKLSNLPEDFFTNMPTLAEVYLNKNEFVTLSEKTFSRAFETVVELKMSDNPFRCDCRMRWLAGAYTPRVFKATCESPESLKGVSMNTIDIKSLWC